MILQIFTVLLVLSIATIGDGASLSNVYVQSEPPVGYYTYGTPYSSIANPRLSQVNSQPSVPGYVAPCVSPCVYPQTVATVTAVDPSPNVVAYNAYNVPVPVAPTKQEYEYSYIVHDEHTGDHKAQRELSDGSVVQGQYSFLQPDGYIREVQYVADDISGFKAVVKNFLPAAAVEGKSNGEEYEKKEPPCHENKNESLKEGSEEDSGEIYFKQLKKIHDILQRKYEESAEKSKETKKIFSEESEENSEEKTKSKKELSESQESEVDSDSEQSKKELKVKSHKKGSKESSDEISEEESEEKVSNGKNKEVHELLKPTDETHVPYKDILRCIEAAMKRNHAVSAAVKQGPSPLTYIVLNKPC